MSAIFTPEDTVALKEDPSITAIVERSWRDIDAGMDLGPAEWIPHSGVREEDVKRAVQEGQPPKGMVEIRLAPPYFGGALIKESDLILKDRGLVTGDVVKRAAADAESGYVVQTDLDCICRPVYTDLPFCGSDPWNHEPTDNEIKVSAEELTFSDFDQGKYVIYKGWVGEVTYAYEHVKVRLSNGSVVRVRKSEDLQMPSHELHSSRPSDYRNAETLGKRLKDEYRRIERHGADVTIEPDVFYPGQRLSTTKSNLRLGEWVIGSYKPSQTPNVVVVETRTEFVEVAWLTYNVFGAQAPATPPSTTLDGHELEDLILYNKHNMSGAGLSSNELGSRRSQGIVVGDYVVFRDPAAAALKYSESSPFREEVGVFRRIPRSIADGFEVNSFFVRETKQRVRVQWQDGTTTLENSTDVIPYLNVDENDLWPGELCSLKSAETRHEGMIKLNRIGVVQSVNAKERMAKVRWFVGSNVSIFEDNLAVMEPGSNLGDLSEDVSEVSVYEVLAYTAITKRRGDLVLISPNEDIIAVQQARALDAATIGGNGQHTINLMRNGIDPERLSKDPQRVSSASEVRWFGEIIDLGLDGQLTVRLGALDRVEDIKVSVNRVFVVVGGDDDDFPPGAGDDYAYSDMSEDMSSVSTEERVIAETIIYEGGERLDNDDDEDAWMTDDDLEEPEEVSLDELEEQPGQVNGKPASFKAEDSDKDEEMTNNDTNIVEENEPTELLNQSDYDFSKFPNQPQGFEILDESPPDDHHYFANTTTLSAALLRRIRKEQKILASSLPDGIWVRTWNERLDILRILILGPRDTPYELAPFVLDVLFKDDYPHSPPQVYFHSWTNGVGRINPNLYEDGKVCLSILGTWPENEKNEGWNKDRSSLLQVLVSLMGLVLVEQPYYNEAGFESLVGTEDTQFASQMYSEKAYCMGKGFVEHALRHPVQGIHPIVQWLYTDPEGLCLLATVVKESKEALVRGKTGDGTTTSGAAGATASANALRNVFTKPSSMRLSTGAEILMNRFLPGLEKRLADLSV